MSWTLLAIAIILGVVAALVPLEATVRKLTVAAAVICFALWLLFLIGFLPSGSHVYTTYH